MKPALLLALVAPFLAQAAEIPAVTAAMKSFVESGEVAGAVTLVADAEKTLHLSATGMADLESARTMRTDELFWIASMTKPVTATAVMILQDEGKLSVDDPVSKHLPEFAALKDAQGNPASITIRQCLTHSSGLAEAGPAEANMVTLADLTRVVAAKPLQFKPGSQWRYCQSSINTAARIVEVVSGETFPAFLDKRLFVPLGMKDTTFYPNAEQLARLATSYSKAEGGKLTPAPLHFLFGKPLSETKRYPRANGGLFSTAEDYAIFCRMILIGGKLNGKRYLSPESVKLMTTVQSGDLQTGFTPGCAWGLGWCVVREPQGVSATLSPGTFGHGGAFGTQAWIDPVKKRAHILLIQRAGLPNSDGSDIRRAFHQAAAGL
jgi:CubicO group peptidase (beta-lactamase class C family)